ncbi:MAG TPA: hypothetical protein VF017_21550 [Thermoanaerobaculia bacterium]|nr:hypothetical protein [Thermoanaerobaculia bacterium]
MPSLHRTKALFLAAGLAAYLFLGPAASAQSCAGGVSNVGVGLMTAVSDPEARRETMHISSSLAQQLGIRPSDPGGFLQFTQGGEINPQLRVVIESPTIDARQSTAIFTVSGIFTDSADRIRVYRSTSSSDKNSGQFKLFKDITAPVEVDVTKINTAGDITGVSARVYWTPVSISTLTANGSTVANQIFCEPTVNGGNTFVENAIVAPAGEDDFALLVPHGGAIEVKTSDQIPTVLDTLANDWSVEGSLWEARGAWSRSQTRERWHITATALYENSFPGLEALFDRADFAPGVPFRYVLALHGYDDSSNLGVILGGQANVEDRCLVALRIQDAAEAARGSRTEIGFRIHRDTGGDITVANSAAYTPPDDHEGDSPNNVVNRLSPNPGGDEDWGGIQIEQSTAVRTDETNGQGQSGATVEDAWLRHVVARGAANAIGELIGSGTPTNACATLTGTP